MHFDPVFKWWHSQKRMLLANSYRQVVDRRLGEIRRLVKGLPPILEGRIDFANKIGLILEEFETSAGESPPRQEFRQANGQFPDGTS